MKAVIAVALAFFLLALNWGGITGAFVNDVAAIREERVQLYLNFPQPDNPVHKQLAYRARNLLRLSAYHNYFDFDGIKSNEYFVNERELIKNLLVLACLQESDIPNRVASAQGISVGSQFIDIGVVSCDPELARSAEHVLGQVMQQDYRLVELNLRNSACAQNARNAMLLAHRAIENGFFDTALTNLQAAWQKAQC